MDRGARPKVLGRKFSCPYRESNPESYSNVAQSNTVRMDISVIRAMTPYGPAYEQRDEMLVRLPPKYRRSPTRLYGVMTEGNSLS